MPPSKIVRVHPRSIRSGDDRREERKYDEGERHSHLGRILSLHPATANGTSVTNGLVPNVFGGDRSQR